MSMHKEPLAALELDGLRAHGLSAESPSQLSDAFRQGMAWSEQSLSRLKAEWQADLIEGLLLNHSEFRHPEAGAIVELMDGLEKALRRQAKEAS